jgi:hypothetical protein
MQGPVFLEPEACRLQPALLTATERASPGPLASSRAAANMVEC